MNRIEFKGIIITPEKIKYVDQEPGAWIELRALLNAEEHSKIKQLWKSQEYFELIIDDSKKITVRLGNPNWSTNNDKYFYHLVFIENKYDENNDDKNNVPDVFYNKNKMITTDISLLLELLNILKDKKILNDDEISELKKRANENALDQKYNYLYVPNLEKYDL